MEHESSSYENVVVPKCPVCESEHVKPDVVFFGQGLPKRFFDLSKKDLPKTDLMIIVGTSLEVYPVAILPEWVCPGTPRFLINRDKVKAKGGWLKNLWDSVKSKLTLGLKDYTGIFDFDSDTDWYIGGDLQENAMLIIQEMGWMDEYEALKAESEAKTQEIQQQMTK